MRSQGHPERANFADAVMLNDTVCWKEVRKAWYNVLIEGIMKDYEAKKKLAKSFIFHYPALMDDFCNDDQEDDYTITNMSLQFFTGNPLYYVFHFFHKSYAQCAPLTSRTRDKVWGQPKNRHFWP